MFGAVKKRIVWFPFLLMAMTVILAVTIVLIDRNRTEQLSGVADVLSVSEQVASTVTSEEYQQAVRSVVAPVWFVLDAGEGDESPIIDVRDALVALRVASESRDIHIQLVAASNQLIQGLQGDPNALADAQIRFNRLVETNLWLK